MGVKCVTLGFITKKTLLWTSGIIVAAFAVMLLRTGGPAAVLEMEATAYSIQGLTKAGIPVREGIVAADPDVLPLGTRIRVHGTLEPLGTFIVADTGHRVRGRVIDIYMERAEYAREFGRKTVLVEVLLWGEGASSVQERLASEP
jgi:3D (Asp-Asp-Asp) domain-containing protein